MMKMMIFVRHALHPSIHPSILPSIYPSIRPSIHTNPIKTSLLFACDLLTK